MFTACRINIVKYFLEVIEYGKLWKSTLRRILFSKLSISLLSSLIFKRILLTGFTKNFTTTIETKLDKKEITSEEIVKSYLDRIEEKEKDVQAFVTITTDDGRDIEFVEIAEIPLNGRVFTILQPTEEMDELDPDDVLIFEVITDEDGNDIVELVDADETIDAVSEAFYALSEESDDE